jgi:hypothetical protein
MEKKNSNESKFLRSELLTEDGSIKLVESSYGAEAPRGYKCANISTSLAFLKLFKFNLNTVLVVVVCVDPSNILNVVFFSLKGSELKSLYNGLFNKILIWFEFVSEKVVFGLFKKIRELSLSKIKYGLSYKPLELDKLENVVGKVPPL